MRRRYKIAWIVMMVAMTAAVVVSVLRTALNPSTANAFSTLIVLVAIGIPIAAEWRHVDEVRSPRPPE